MTTRAVYGADADGWTNLNDLADDELATELVAVINDPHPDQLERCLNATAPGGVLRVVTQIEWDELELRMLEGGWATFLPVSSGSTMFGDRTDDPAAITVFDDHVPDAVIAEATR